MAHSHSQVMRFMAVDCGVGFCHVKIHFFTNIISQVGAGNRIR